MAYGTYGVDYEFVRAYQEMVLYTCIGVGIFTLGSFILGCIMYFVCRKPPRRGMILSSDPIPQATEAQEQVSMQELMANQNQIQHIQPPNSYNQPMQPFPPETYAMQQKSIYPSVSIGQ